MRIRTQNLTVVKHGNTGHKGGGREDGRRPKSGAGDTWCQLGPGTQWGRW